MAKKKKPVKKNKKVKTRSKPKKTAKKLKSAKKAKKAIKVKKAIITKPPVKIPAPKPVKQLKKAEIKIRKGPHTAYIGIGSNVGDREEHLEQAIFLISKIPGVKLIKKSTNHETQAEGNEDQPTYLNAAVEVETSLDPYKLLSALQEAENALGREREVDWGPRTIDIDLLLYEDQIISDDNLQVPHPLMHERVFVLKPLSEIAPKVEHPALERTIEDLYEERKAELGDKYDDDLPGFKDIKKGTPDDFERW